MGKKMELVWSEVALNSIKTRIAETAAEVESLQQSLGSEAKSTAGDKHETGRAMIQIDMERATAKLHEWRATLANTQRLFSTPAPTDQVRLGHAVETDGGWFLLGPPLGKLTAPSGESCFALSAASPLGQLLVGKRQGDVFRSGPREFQILTICN